MTLESNYLDKLWEKKFYKDQRFYKIYQNLKQTGEPMMEKVLIITLSFACLSKMISKY